MAEEKHAWPRRFHIGLKPDAPIDVCVAGGHAFSKFTSPTPKNPEDPRLTVRGSIVWIYGESEWERLNRALDSVLIRCWGKEASPSSRAEATKLIGDYLQAGDISAAKLVVDSVRLGIGNVVQRTQKLSRNGMAGRPYQPPLPTEDHFDVSLRDLIYITEVEPVGDLAEIEQFMAGQIAEKKKLKPIEEAPRDADDARVQEDHREAKRQGRRVPVTSPEITAGG